MFAKVASPTLPRSLNTRALNAALLSGSYNLDIGPSPPRSSFLNTGTGPSLLPSSCYQGQGRDDWDLAATRLSAPQRLRPPLPHPITELPQTRLVLATV